MPHISLEKYQGTDQDIQNTKICAECGISQ